MNNQEKAKLAAQTKFIYIFREIKTNKVIYVGQTKFLGRRLNEHRTALKEKNYAGIYVYMRENNLEFFKNVEVVIVGYTQSREEACKLEAELIKRYATTVQNNVKYDTRKYNTDPRFRQVECVETGEIFGAITFLMEKLNLSRYHINKAIMANKPIYGFHYRYVKK